MPPGLERPSPTSEWPPASAGSLLSLPSPLFPSLLLLFSLASSPGPSPPALRPREGKHKGAGSGGVQGGVPRRPTHPRAPPLLSPLRFRGGGYSWGSRGRATTWLESQMKSCFLIPKTDRQYNVWLCLQINTSAAEIEDFAIVTKPRHYHLKNYYFLL